MQEEVTSKTIALAIKTAKLDGKVLQAALQQFMQLYHKLPILTHCFVIVTSGGNYNILFKQTECT